MLKDLRGKQTEVTKIMWDNIHLFQSQIFRCSTITPNTSKFHFIKEFQQSKEVLLNHCTFEDQLVDIFT